MSEIKKNKNYNFAGRAISESEEGGDRGRKGSKEVSWTKKAEGKKHSAVQGVGPGVRTEGESLLWHCESWNKSCWVSTEKVTWEVEDPAITTAV